MQALLIHLADETESHNFEIFFFYFKNMQLEKSLNQSAIPKISSLSR